MTEQPRQAEERCGIILEYSHKAQKRTRHNARRATAGLQSAGPNITILNFFLIEFACPSIHTGGIILSNVCSTRNSISFNHPHHPHPLSTPIERNTMFRSTPLLLRRVRALPRPSSAATLRPTARSISTTHSLQKDDGETKPGQFARTDPSITVEYPAEKDTPSSKPPWRYGQTLKSFSLEGKVAVVTGGAGGFVYYFLLMEGGREEK